MKKRIISIVLLIAIVSTLFAGCSFEEFEKKLVKDDGTVDPATVMVADLLNKNTQNLEYSSDSDFEYVLYDDNTASITKYNNAQSVLEIPSEVTLNVNGADKTYTIVGIDNKSFYKNDSIVDLVIPDSVEVIGNFAFMSCKNLETVIIGKGVKYIGVSAFQADKAPQNDRKARLDDEGKEIINRDGDKVYYDSIGKLKEITWRGAPEVIAEKAFYLNDKLVEIVLPEGVKEIGEWAFAKCSGANKIILPEGVATIGAFSFMKNISVEEIVIPGSCSVISQSAFYRNLNAKTVTIGDGVTTIEQGAFEECESVKEFDLPASVQTVGKYAFYNCTDVQAVKVSQTATLNKEIGSEKAIVKF